MLRLLPDPSPTPLTGRELRAAYAVPAARQVRANLVHSADGGIEVGGRSAPLSSPADRALLRLLRELSDVVLVGAGTVRREGYGPARLSADARERRAQEKRSEVPTIAIVSASLDLNLTSRLFTAASVRSVVVTPAASSLDRRATCARVADVIVAGDERVDLAAALDALAERGLHRVLCEGGPHLLRGLLDGGLVDELCLTTAPLLTGAGHGQLVPEPSLARPLPLELTHLLAEGGALFARWSLPRADDPGPPA